MRKLIRIVALTVPFVSQLGVPVAASHGGVYINSTPEHYLKMASDIDARRSLPNYLALRKFSDPPQLVDLAGFTLDDEEIKELQHCKSGHCEVQLPTEAMEGFLRSVDWSAPDGAAQAVALRSTGLLNP